MWGLASGVTSQFGVWSLESLLSLGSNLGSGITAKSGV